MSWIRVLLNSICPEPRKCLMAAMIALSCLALACSGSSERLSAGWSVAAEQVGGPTQFGVWVLVEDPHGICTGGNFDPERIETEVDEQEDEEGLRVLVDKPPTDGDHTCPSNPLAEVWVELDAPVEDRRLVELEPS